MKRKLPAAAGWAQPLDDYLVFLERHKGVLVVEHQGSELRRFTREVESSAPIPSRCTLDCLDNWVREVSARSSVSGATLRKYVGAVRGFLRWMYQEQIVERDLAGDLECPIAWREATIPSHFTWDEVQQLIRSVHTDRPQGLLDQALVLLFAGCGLRAMEAARLKVEDINVAARTVRIWQRKCRDWLVLPLPTVTVAALTAYLQDGRPPSPHPELFLTWQGLPFLQGSSVSRRIRELAARAGLGRERGAQAIRRAVGTRLVEQGATLGQVALMLGHGSVESSRGYVRVSMQMLAEVADNYGELL